MTPPSTPPLAVHQPVLTHHNSRSHEIEASLRSISGSSFIHRGDDPAVAAQTLDPKGKECVKLGTDGISSEVGGGGGGVGNDGCGGGGVVAAPNLAVTFSVGTAQEQGKQHVDSRTTERTEQSLRPLSIGSVGSLEAGGGGGGGILGNSRETSSYVWRVLVYLAFINPFLSFLCTLYAILILLAVLVTYPIRSFLLPKGYSYPTTSGLAYLLLLHLRFIYPQPTRSPRSILPLVEDIDPARLIVIHLFGPFLAIALAVVSWILVFVWIYTEVLLGEKNKSTSAEYRSVMFVKERWENYIFIALKPKSLDGY